RSGRLFLAGLVLLFAASYLPYGVRSTMIEDDFVFCYPNNKGEDIDTADLIRRIAISSGPSRFLTHLLHRWTFPRVAEHFWVVHLAIVILHAGNSVLVWRFARRFWGADGPAIVAASL